MQQVLKADTSAAVREADHQRVGRDDLDLVEYVREVWRARNLVLLSGLVLGVLGCIASFLLPKQYDATLIAMPVLDQGGGALGALGSVMGQFGGLASLAGINLPDKSQDEEAIAVLQSQMLTRRFITENNLLPVLYPKRWDSVTQRWKSGDVPGLWKANRYFNSKIRDVSEDRETGLVTLTIRWKDPVQAAAWANELVRLTNDELREQAIQLAQRNIDYLNEQAGKTNVIEVKAAIYSLLQGEIEKEMFARGREQYALKVVDPAYVPEKPAWPRPLLLSVLCGMLGVFLALAYVYGRKVLQLSSTA